MNFLTTYIKNLVREAGVLEYELVPELHTIAKSSALDLYTGEDIYVLANVFTGGGTISGKIVAGNNAINLTPAFLNQTITKFKDLRGSISITNSSTTETLYVEFVRIIPRKINNTVNDARIEVVKQTFIEILKGITV